MSNVIDFKKVKFQPLERIKASMESFREALDTEDIADSFASLEEGKYKAIFRLGPKIYEIELVVVSEDELGAQP